MVDVHSHIIFGLDDGASSIEESLEMAIQAVSRGVTHIIATPHYNDFISDTFFDKRDAHCEALNLALQEKKIPVTIEAAAEISFASHWDTVLNEPRCFIREKYILIEFSDIDVPTYFPTVLFRIRQQGLIPIIAHPERSIPLQKDITLIKEMVRLGAHFQCDAGSLSGHFGEQTKKCAEKFVRMNLYQIMGSDAHEPQHRNYLALPELSPFNYFNNLLLDQASLPEITLVESNQNQSFFKRIFGIK